MAIMRDVEGVDLESFFDLTLYSWKEVKHDPSLSLSVPLYFETDDGFIYDSSGVLTVPLKDLLEEYLTDFWQSDRGKGLPKLISILRDYAGKFEKALRKRRGKS